MNVPHDLDTERALLGAMLLGEAPVLAAADLSSGDFHSPAHATVFAVLQHLHRQGHPVEIVGARAELLRRGELEPVGGHGFLIDLQGSCPSTSAAPRYVEVIAGHARMRRLALAAERIRDLALRGEDPGETFEEAVATLERVDSGARSSTLAVLTRDQLDTIPPPEWLIEGLTTTGFTVIYGPSGVGKSFVALDWACAVATGSPWFGRVVARRVAMYVASEGTSGIPRRVAAWETDRHVRATDLVLVPQVVNLLSAGDVAALAAEVRQRSVGLLVVDTLARSMPGGDENGAQDMGRLIHSLSDIQSRTGCAVVLVHHSGVEKSRMRGSTSLYGAADTVVKVEGEHGLVFVTCEKQKDDDTFQPWHLRMKPVGGSIVLTLSGGAQSDDALARLRSELADGRRLPYLDIIRLAGGDGQVVLKLVEAGKLVRCEDDDRLYTLAEHVERVPVSAHDFPEF